MSGHVYRRRFRSLFLCAQWSAANSTCLWTGQWRSYGVAALAEPRASLEAKHWNRFKGNVGETSETQGGAQMGFSERKDTILN